MQENRYRPYTLHNYKELPQISNLSPQDIEAIEAEIAKEMAELKILLAE